MKMGWMLSIVAAATLLAASTALAQGRGPGHRPPKEAVDACASLKAGDACSFTLDNHSITGTCRGPQGMPAACAPADLPPPGEHRGPPQAALDACKSLRDGDTCSFTIDSRDVKGTCRTGPDGQPAACLPNDLPPPPHRR